MNKTLLLSSLLVVPLVAQPGSPQGSGPDSETARQEVEATLTDFHRAAEEADAERYFSYFAKDAVFLGTDASERWTARELRTLLEPVFARGEKRKTVPGETNVTVADDGHLAWFDQRLESERWGEMRGTGVLRKADGRWKIVQYVWSFPVPNELVPELTERFREFRAK